MTVLNKKLTAKFLTVLTLMLKTPVNSQFFTTMNTADSVIAYANENEDQAVEVLYEFAKVVRLGFEDSQLNTILRTFWANFWHELTKSLIAKLFALKFIQYKTTQFAIFDDNQLIGIACYPDNQDGLLDYAVAKQFMTDNKLIMVAHSYKSDKVTVGNIISLDSKEFEIKPVDSSIADPLSLIEFGKRMATKLVINDNNLSILDQSFFQKYPRATAKGSHSQASCISELYLKNFMESLIEFSAGMINSPYLKVIDTPQLGKVWLFPQFTWEKKGINTFSIDEKVILESISYMGINMYVLLLNLISGEPLKDILYTHPKMISSSSTGKSISVTDVHDVITKFKSYRKGLSA